MPLHIQALLLGLIAGFALIVGVALASVPRIPPRLIAGVMAFGAGVLISALSFELIEEAHRRGGLTSTAIGFLCGAIAFTAVNVWITRSGGHHRKRSADHMQQKAHEGSGVAIAIGAMFDGIPESVTIGVGLLADPNVGLIAVAAVSLSNIPEGLSSATGMRKSGRSSAYIYGVWGAIALGCGIAALLGNLALANSSPEVIAVVLAVAAGAILAMIVDTMIPEAFEATHEYAGLITVFGFLTAFALAKFAAH
jgi:ZIP family zinc transporter